MANRSKSMNSCSCASRPRFCRGMLLVIGFLFAFSRAGVADTRAGDPLVQPCLESLEGVNREIAQGASSRKVLLKLQQLKTTVKRAAPELNAGEKAKYQVLLEDTIEPAIVELAQNGDAPVTARARQNVRRAKSAVVQPAPVQPLISGKIDFETARGKKCSWDLGTLVQSLQRNPSKPSAAATRPATAADIATVRSFITSGKGTWLPNLRQWFRFKHRPMTPETISRRVAGFLEDYVSRPENLPRLGRDLGLKIPMKARIASVVIRTMRWCGLKVTIPGGDPETIETVRDLVFELSEAFDDEVFRLFWGQLRTGMNMYQAQTNKDGWLIFRDTFRGFADPRLLTDTCGLTLTPAQVKELTPVFRAEADAVFAAMKEFYKIRTQRGCDESFSSFLDAIIDDFVHALKVSIALRQQLQGS